MTTQPANKSFKETYTKEKRIKMCEDNRQKHKNCVIVIVEKDPKCKALPDLKHCRFSIATDQKIMEVCNAIRKRIIDIDCKFQSQPFFLFTNKIMPNKELSIKQIYAAQKDPQDGLLYFKYSNLDPYGSVIDC